MCSFNFPCPGLPFCSFPLLFTSCLIRKLMCHDAEPASVFRVDRNEIVKFVKNTRADRDPC